jgi:hypothetical protein
LPPWKGDGDTEWETIQAVSTTANAEMETTSGEQNASMLMGRCTAERRCMA